MSHKFNPIREKQMRALCEKAVSLMRMRKVGYGDVRYVHRRRQQIEVKNGAVESVTFDENAGFGVRVLVDGAWGFSASNRTTDEEMTRVVTEAIDVARASGTVLDKRLELTRVPAALDTYSSECEIDPFEVPLAEKLEMLTEANETLSAEKAVSIAQCFLSCFETHKTFASTEGAFIIQKITESGGGLAATAIKDGELQVRSYPNSFRGNFATRGYEYVQAMDLPGNAARVAEEAARLIVAPQCPSGTRTII